MKEQVEEVLIVVKEMIKTMSRDEELLKLTAELSAKYLDYFIEAGFTREEAMKLVVKATMSLKSSS